MANNRSLLTETITFLKVKKPYWLAPIIITLVLVGVLILLGQSSISPFIYTLF